MAAGAASGAPVVRGGTACSPAPPQAAAVIANVSITPIASRGKVKMLFMSDLRVASLGAFRITDHPAHRG